MAGVDAAIAQEQTYLNLCQLRELFHGRFTDQEAAFLLEKNKGDVREAANHVFTSDPQDLRRELEAEAESWTFVEKVKGIKSNRTIKDQAKSGQIDTTARMFACLRCDNFWWRRTPERKMVSKCKRCNKKYDALPRDQEWGWAEFRCGSCNREFGGWSAMGMTSPCYHCGAPVSPIRIVPPDRRKLGGRNRHRCNAPDCMGNPHRIPSHMIPPGQLSCVHPASRRANGLPIVVSPSMMHDSTGSTVDTFLPQDDLELHFEEFFRPPLPSIPE